MELPVAFAVLVGAFTCPVSDHFDKVFGPNLGVGLSFQIRGNRGFVCGLELETVLILNRNPISETADRFFIVTLELF